VFYGKTALIDGAEELAEVRKLGVARRAVGARIVPYRLGKQGLHYKKSGILCQEQSRVTTLFKLELTRRLFLP
jgi:hypothetical protein